MGRSTSALDFTQFHRQVLPQLLARGGKTGLPPPRPGYLHWRLNSQAAMRVIPILPARVLENRGARNTEF